MPNVAPAVVCLEGPSAVGKTTLASALAAECGAAVAFELEATGAPPAHASAAWFVDRHAAQWRLARERAAAARAPFAVLDGDPFKGLWYNWMHADQGWEGVDVVAPLYRAHVERGTLAFPDLYVVLDATEAQLRDRRAHDPTRTRRNHEMHLRPLPARRRYFAELRAAAPQRVVLLDTADRTALVGRVVDALRGIPAGQPDSLALLERLAEWVRTHGP